MRLLRKVGKLERAVAAGQSPYGGEPLGIVWTRDNVRLPESVELAGWQHVARDVHVLAERDWAASGMPSEYRIEERVGEGEDYGEVFAADGRRLGRVRPPLAGAGPEILDIEWWDPPPGA